MPRESFPIEERQEKVSEESPCSVSKHDTIVSSNHDQHSSVTPPSPIRGEGPEIMPQVDF